MVLDVPYRIAFVDEIHVIIDFDFYSQSMLFLGTSQNFPEYYFRVEKLEVSS